MMKLAFEVRLLDPSVLFPFVVEVKAVVEELRYTTLTGFVSPEGTNLRVAARKAQTRGSLVLGKITKRKGPSNEKYRLAFHGPLWASFWDELVDVFALHGITIVQAKPRKVK